MGCGAGVWRKYTVSYRQDTGRSAGSWVKPVGMPCNAPLEAVVPYDGLWRGGVVKTHCLMKAGRRREGGSVGEVGGNAL